FGSSPLQEHLCFLPHNLRKLSLRKQHTKFLSQLQGTCSCSAASASLLFLGITAIFCNARQVILPSIALWDRSTGNAPAGNRTARLANVTFHNFQRLSIAL